MRTGEERGTIRMGWTGTRLIAMGGLTEGQNGRKMARKMAKERTGRRGGA